MSDPRGEYSRRLEIRAAKVAAEERRHVRAGNLKLATLAAGAVMAWLWLGRGALAGWWMFAPAAVYCGLIVFHERVLRARARANIAAEFYRRGLARMDDCRDGTGTSGERFRDPANGCFAAYADDLDIFGSGCLFELLCTARTPMGEERLAKWLCGGSTEAQIIERQNAAAALREKLDLRESIATTGEALRSKLNPGRLAQWAEERADLPPGAMRWLIAAAAAGVMAALAYGVASRNYWPLAALVGAVSAIRLRYERQAKAAADSLDCNADGLKLLAAVLARLEAEEFAPARLREMAAGLAGDERASRAMAGLSRILYWMDGRTGTLGRLLDFLGAYTVQMAMAAESWRRKHGARVRGWLDAAAEMEALLSLACYSYEHPADPFPEFAADGGGALFEGEELGHPLIPAETCVRNSARLDSTTRALLVSGSNMSGKSTFLRTVGINAVLALAGAPIRGKSLRLSMLSLGTRIRSTDSLQEGRSNFYTEILRIREVLRLAAERPPVLFLFDELLEGTNSADRLTGAQGLIGGLLRKGAIGIVTTHDLALTEICRGLDGLMRNAHFQDYVENGKMRFDYKLRDGIVEKSNAIELMRLIGWEV